MSSPLCTSTSLNLLPTPPHIPHLQLQLHLLICQLLHPLLQLEQLGLGRLGLLGLLRRLRVGLIEEEGEDGGDQGGGLVEELGGNGAELAISDLQVLHQLPQAQLYQRALRL